MKKKIFISLSLIVVITLNAFILGTNLIKAAPEVNSVAVSYLKAQTQGPWITMALAAASEAEIPTSHLTTVSGETILVTDYAKAILALTAIGEDPTAFGDVDYVAQLKTYYENQQFGNNGWINDDVWAILALASINQADLEEVTNAKNFLLANQNSDGGWSHAVGGPSDTNDTAVAIMALLEVGFTASDSVITNAVGYLQSSQNDDGGFPYDPNPDTAWGGNTDSDSSSDAWVISVIYKLGQDPAAWTKSGGNPISHLKSFQDEDGGFWWVEPGTSEYNNKASTAHAVIALAGKSHPLNKITLTSPSAEKFSFRLEGSQATICEGETQGPTALDIVKNAATQCAFTYEIIEDPNLGSYLKKINDDDNSWLYFVNNISPLVGAGAYTLETNDEVLWFFGDWNSKPTKLELSETEITTGESTEATVTFFDTTWQPLESATVKAGSESFTTNAQGKATLSLADGYYNISAKKDGFVQSAGLDLKVGEADSQDLGLIVNITDDGQGSPGPGNNQPAETELSFSIDVENINFGDMAPGSSKTQNITLTNQSQSNLHFGAEVTGASVFQENLFIAQRFWPSFALDLIQAATENLDIALSIPSSYSDGTGQKSGVLTFWAMEIE